MMNNLLFIVGSVAWVQYFIPIIIEGNKRNLKSYFFIRQNPKAYANVYEKHHLKQIKEVCKLFNIVLLPISDVSKFKGLTFLMEGDISGTSQRDIQTSGLLHLNNNHYKVSFSFNADFIWTYPKYVNLVDSIILPSKSYAIAYNKTSSKLNCIGSPKFDIPLNDKKIYEKYGLNTKNKHCLFFYPKNKWIKTCNKLKNTQVKMTHIVKCLKQFGFKVIIKTREKDRVIKHMGDYYFEETHLYPNNSIELLHICNFAIFFSSATIEECVMLSTPFIDFKVDMKFDRFAFLYNKRYSRIINDIEINYNDLSKQIKEIINCPEDVFEDMRNKHLFKNQNFCNNLLNHYLPLVEERIDKHLQTQKQIELLKQKYIEINEKKKELLNNNTETNINHTEINKEQNKQKL